MSLVTIAGYASLLYILAKLLTYLSKYVRSPLDVSKLGDWSLVTGATDGIGKKIFQLCLGPGADLCVREGNLHGAGQQGAEHHPGQQDSQQAPDRGQGDRGEVQSQN